MTIKTISRLKCKNCGDTWGGHTGKFCLAGKKGSVYDPFGDLEKICARCGEPFEDHISHFRCRDDNSKIFTYEDGYADDHKFLEKELFEL